jgi:transposase
LTEELVARHQLVARGVERVTLIFDKGNNSQDNLTALADSPYHFIGSLVPSQHPELLAIPARRFRSLADDGFPQVTAYRTSKEVFGQRRTVLVTYNEALFVAQSRTLLRQIAKRQQQLHALQAQLCRWHSGTVRGGKPPTAAGTQKKVDGWLAARHMKELFAVTVAATAQGLPTLTDRFHKTAWERLQRTLLGKTILFTDNDDWPDADIVRGYRSQHQVESAFRHLKDPHYLSLRPQRHWTDQKIKVHVFYCVLALTLSSLLQRELNQRGIERSIPALLAELSQIREITLIYPPTAQGGSPTVRTTLSHLTPSQQALYEALDLQRHRAT